MPFYQPVDRPAKLAIAVVFSLACLASAAPALPQAAEKLPSAATVLERDVEATGERALLRYKSMTIHTHFQIPARHLEVEVVTYTGGGKYLQKGFLPNGKEDVSGYDGQTAWGISPDGKVTIETGDVVKTVARDADMYYHLHVLKYFKSMEVVDLKE